MLIKKILGKGEKDKTRRTRSPHQLRKIGGDVRPGWDSFVWGSGGGRKSKSKEGVLASAGGPHRGDGWHKNGEKGGES